MSMQPTSTTVFKDEVFPTLGARQRRVLEVLEAVGNLTNTELAQRLGWMINRVTPRVNELRKRGVVEEACKRTCVITGRKVMAWRIKKNAPKPIERDDPKTYQFASKSDPKMLYKVSVNSGRAFCSCPGFHYRGYCSHTTKIQAFVDQKQVTHSLFSA